MRLLTSIILFLTISFFSNCQIEYKGFTFDSILKIDRLDGGFGMIFLDCFTDSTSSELFTGKVVSFQRGVPKDTMYVLNGKVDRCAKMYNVYVDSPPVKNEFVYVIRNELIDMELIIQTREKTKVVFVCAKTKEDKFFVYKFYFKKSKTIVKRLIVGDSKKGESEKQNFHLKNNYNLYQFMREDGLIPVDVIDEIKLLKLMDQLDLSFYFEICK